MMKEMCFWVDQTCYHIKLSVSIVTYNLVIPTYPQLAAQNKEGILPVATLNVTQLTVTRQRYTFSEAEEYMDVYKGDDNFATFGAALLSGLDLQET